MATIKLRLNKARRLNDGTYPLVIQIIHRREKRIIYSKVYLCEEEFDEKRGTVVINRTKCRTNKDYKMLKRTIDEFKQGVEQTIDQCDRNGLPYTTEEVVRKYRIVCCGPSLGDYWQERIRQTMRLGRLGTGIAQLSTLRSVLRFKGSEYFGFAEVNSSFVKSYHSYLLSCGLSLNTIAFYMRNFKSTINSAIREGRIKESESDIFKGINMCPKKTVKRALIRNELRLLMEMTFENEPGPELVRDLFLFSFYTRGMAFVDIVFLKKENLSENYIHYTRHKTGQLLRIGINNPIRNLIMKYDSVSQYIFPAVHSSDPTVAYGEYRKALRLSNLWLKIIGKRAGIQTSLTTYAARHSWATQAKEHGAPVAVISEGLGHTSEKITQIYLKDFDHSVLDTLNDRVVDLQ